MTDEELLTYGDNVAKQFIKDPAPASTSNRCLFPSIFSSEYDRLFGRVLGRMAVLYSKADVLRV